MKIEILGGGCANCAKLYKSVEEAVSTAGITAEILKVEDYGKIIEYGITSTPALAVDGIVVSAGKVIKSDDIRTLLKF